MGTPSRVDLVSVVIPCHNQGKYLADAVRSVLDQTHRATEIIVVDDGSTDNTADVASSFGSRVQFVQQQTGGSAAARNTGLGLVTGEWVQFLDADDVLLPEKIETCLRAAQGARRPCVVYTDYYRCPEDDVGSELPGGRISPQMDTSRPAEELAGRWENDLSIPIHAFLFDAAFFARLGFRFDGNLMNHEDWDLWMRIMFLSPTVIYVDRPLVAYRRTPDSKCRADPRVRGVGFRDAIRKQLRVTRGNAVLHRTLTHKLVAVQTRYGLTPAHIRLWHWLRSSLVSTLHCARRMASAAGARRVRQILTNRLGRGRG